jgi:hypothetical protein
MCNSLPHWLNDPGATKPATKSIPKETADASFGALKGSV